MPCKSACAHSKSLLSTRNSRYGIRVLRWVQAQLAYTKAKDTFAVHQTAMDDLVGRRDDAYSQLLRLQDPTAPPATQLVASVLATPPPPPPPCPSR